MEGDSIRKKTYADPLKTTVWGTLNNHEGTKNTKKNSSDDWEMPSFVSFVPSWFRFSEVPLSCSGYITPTFYPWLLITGMTHNDKTRGVFRAYAQPKKNAGP